MLNVPTFDPEMKEFILDCARAGMTADAITEELHRQDFSWVERSDVAHLIDQSIPEKS